MGSQQSARDFDWGFLIQADKSPSPRLEQLCLGLAGVISGLDPSSATKELTPEKLAAFYRAVGGNYDSLFLNTPSPSLSFIYQSLGCFHTLQPTKSAFEPPSIPALLPHGFIRWQTIQLLLCPEEHAPFLQRAVEMFDIVDPHEGYLLPKSIPASAFPTIPDPDMVKWHETVSNRLELESAESTPNVRPPNHPHPSNAQTRTRSSRNGDDEGDYFTQGHHYSAASRKPHPATKSRPTSREPYGRNPHPLRHAEAANYSEDAGLEPAIHVRPGGQPRPKSSNHYRGHSSPPAAYRRSWAHPESDDDEIIVVEHVRFHPHPPPQDGQRHGQEYADQENLYPSRSSRARHHSHESMYRRKQTPREFVHEAPRRRPDEEEPDLYYSYPPPKHSSGIKSDYEDNGPAAFPAPRRHSQSFHPRYVDIFDDSGHHIPESSRRGSRASAHAERTHLPPMNAENSRISPPISPLAELYGDPMTHMEPPPNRPLRHQSLKEPRQKKGRRGSKGVDLEGLPRSHSRDSPSRRRHHYYQDYRHADEQIPPGRAQRERSRSHGPRRGEDETWSESDSSIDSLSDGEYSPAPGKPYAGTPLGPMAPTAGQLPRMASTGGPPANSRRAKYAAKLEATIMNGLRSGSKDKRRKEKGSSGSGDGNGQRSRSSHRR